MDEGDDGLTFADDLLNIVAIDGGVDLDLITDGDLGAVVGFEGDEVVRFKM